VVSFTPLPLYPLGKYLIGMEVGWAPDPVWTLRSREESLAPAGNRTPGDQPLARRYVD
jgi:hypothetical protein